MNGIVPSALHSPNDKVSPTRPFNDDPARSYNLPAHHYYDPGVYRLEQERIFYRSWILVCHVEGLREVGAYATMAVGDQNVVVIRGKDGVLRAFYNVCQHRGHELLKGCGKAKVITCPYHAWSYHADGRLRTARGTDDLPDFDPARFALKPVRLEEFCNFVFVDLDGEAAPLKAQLGQLEAEMRGYLPDLDRLTFSRRLTFDLKANWKIVVDNFIECYHCAVAHPAFAELVDLPSYRTKTYGIHSSHLGKTGRGDNSAYKFEITDEDPGFAAWWVWPYLTFIINPGCANLIVLQMNPAGPEQTLEHIDFYFLDKEPTPLEQASIDYFNDVLNPEDVALVESVQRGLHSRGYNQGRYVVDAGRTQNSEHGLHHFHGLVLSALAGNDLGG